jgi:tetratricopeptide (TPR) repeat protein
VFAIAAVPFAIIAKLAQPALTIDSPLWARPLIAMDSVAFYAGKILFPHPLVFDYGRTPTYVIQTGAIAWTPLVTIGLLAVIAILLRRRAWAPACGLIILLAAPAHTLGLVKFEFQDVSTVADHYLYVAMLGVSIVAAWMVLRWRGAGTILVIILAAWVLRSGQQTLVWRDHPTLMQHGFRYTPHGKVPATNLASWAIERRDLSSAIKYSEISLANTPDEPVAVSNAGYVALLVKDEVRARQMFERYVGLYASHFGADDPRTAEAWVKAAEAFADAGLLDDARRCAQQAHRIAPQSPGVQSLLGSLRTP